MTNTINQTAPTAYWNIVDQSNKAYLVECTNCGNHYIIGNNIPFDTWCQSENKRFCGCCGYRMLQKISHKGDNNDNNHCMC